MFAILAAIKQNRGDSTDFYPQPTRATDLKELRTAVEFVRFFSILFDCLRDGGRMDASQEDTVCLTTLHSVSASGIIIIIVLCIE